MGPSTASLANAAKARGIPFRRLTAGSLVQLGWGSKARKFQAAEVDQTSSVAETIAQDKDLTKRLLHAAGVPVPMGRPVKDVEDAWKVAEEVGFPVVVKPQDGNQGKGVTVNTVSPGYIGTDMVKAIRPDVLEKIVGVIPVKRLGEPKEIASMVSWLASEDGSYATGADFSVNGGLHMH